jgi:hypothetical protein
VFLVRRVWLWMGRLVVVLSLCFLIFSLHSSTGLSPVSFLSVNLSDRTVLALAISMSILSFVGSLMILASCW